MFLVTLLVALVLTAVSSGEQPSPGLRFALVDSEAPTRVARLRKQLAGVPFGNVEVSSAAKVDAASLERADVIVLRAAAPERSVTDEISKRVNGGTPLIFLLPGDSSLEVGDDFARLLGFSREVPGRLANPKSEPLAVSVDNQRHPITQSVTHFVHHGRLTEAKLVSTAEVLASALARTRKLAGDPRPVIWTNEGLAAPVLVCVLDLESGESTGLVRVLVERATEWTRGKWVKTPLDAKGKVRWVAEELGSDDTGLLPGRKPRAGFFRGRQIAPFMTHHGAGWLIRPDREESEQPEKVLDSLNIRAGHTVADLGCGNGYFTLRMAKRVGETGRVLGVDIQKEMLTLLLQRVLDAGLDNVEPILGKEDDPRLPENAVDLVLMVDTYHELANPAGVIKHVWRALKPGGRVVLVEYRGEDPSVPIKPLHRMTERQARAELVAMGFRWVETKGFLPQQHLLIFEKPSGSDAKRQKPL